MAEVQVFKNNRIFGDIEKQHETYIDLPKLLINSDVGPMQNE